MQYLNISLAPVIGVYPRKIESFAHSSLPTIRKTFIQKIKEVIEENMDDENFSIPQLCRVIGLSRSQLHNKIKANTSLSTSIYIRSIRLKRAEYLLKFSDLNVSEVAYEVGFKDPSYFSRLFSEIHGVSPSKVRAARY